VPYTSLARLAAGCLVATDLDPPRLLARWPSADTLGALAVSAATAGSSPGG
jgi:hypothetical protein